MLVKMNCFGLWDTLASIIPTMNSFYACIPNVLYGDIRSNRDINYGDI